MNHIDRRNPQRINLLNMLLDGPVCGLTRNPYIGARLSARILELRQLGFNIETRRCEHPQHAHRTRQIEYLLGGDDGTFALNVLRCPFCGSVDLLIAGTAIDTGADGMTCLTCGKGFLR